MKKFEAGQQVWVRATYNDLENGRHEAMVQDEFVWVPNDDIRADVPEASADKWYKEAAGQRERAEAAEKARDEWKASYEKLREWWNRDRLELCDAKQALELAESVARLSNGVERERAEKAEQELAEAKAELGAVGLHAVNDLIEMRGRAERAEAERDRLQSLWDLDRTAKEHFMRERDALKATVARVEALAAWADEARYSIAGILPEEMARHIRRALRTEPTALELLDKIERDFLTEDTHALRNILTKDDVK